MLIITVQHHIRYVTNVAKRVIFKMYVSVLECQIRIMNRDSRLSAGLKILRMGKNRPSKPLSHKNNIISRGFHSGGSQSASSSNHNKPDNKGIFTYSKQQPMKMNLEKRKYLNICQCGFFHAGKYNIHLSGWEKARCLVDTGAHISIASLDFFTENQSNNIFLEI